VVRVEPDWFAVQRGRDTSDAHVSAVVDLGGVVRCTCSAGLVRRGCDHMRAGLSLGIGTKFPGLLGSPTC
jgi:microsomal dipeptidase-like Zn-dependent dipeptidase